MTCSLAEGYCQILGIRMRDRSNKLPIILIYIALALVSLLAPLSEAVCDETSGQLFESLTVPELIRVADSLDNEQEYEKFNRLSHVVVERAKREFGEADTVFALALRILSRSRYHDADIPDATRLCKLALDICRRAVGSDHPVNTEILMTLAAYRSKVGEFEEVHNYVWESLRILQDYYGEYHIETLYCMLRIPMYLAGKDMYEERLEFLRRSLVIADSIHAPAYLFNSIYSGLAYDCRILGKYSEAESYSMERLQILATLDSVSYYETHRICRMEQEAHCRSELGSLCQILGRLDESKMHLERALTVCDSYGLLDGNFRSTIGITLTKNLGNLYMSIGQYDDAERLTRRSFELRKKLYPNDPNLAEAINNLGDLYVLQGKYDMAEDCYLRALEYREPFYGSDHSFLFYHLRGLGEVYVAQGRFAEADTVLKRCLKISESQYGLDHLHTALTLKAIGDSYMAQEQYPEAEAAYLRALNISVDQVGKANSKTAEIMSRMAKLYGSWHRFSEAIQYYDRLLKSRHGFINDVFSHTSEKQKLRFLDLYPLIDCSLLSLALIDTSCATRGYALEMILKGKAAVIDAIAAQKELAAQCPAADELSQLYNAYRETRGKISDIAIARFRSSRKDLLQNQIGELGRKRDSLEIEMSRHCVEIQNVSAIRDLSLSSVVEKIPPGAVLCEFIIYNPYDFDIEGNDAHRTGEARYLATTIDAKSNLRLYDLGLAFYIDSLVHLTRRRIYETQSCLEPELMAASENRLRLVTSELYHTVFEPIAASLTDDAHLLISPDGELNLVPFEILPNSDSSYLVEKYEISYLSSGRDLLRFEKPSKCSDEAIVMADPDFQASFKDLSVNRNEIQRSGGDGFWSTYDQRGVIECAMSNFVPLSFTRNEGDSVASILESTGHIAVNTFYGADARENVLKHVSVPPRVLHLATHGYFCASQTTDHRPPGENPLLQSGLAMAGANSLSDSGFRLDEDGILTALEVSGLNLLGTELAVLSACETGIGDVRNGEGVLGFRRSFQHAGVRTVLMSLWKVPDESTSTLMQQFYRNWVSGLTKKDALRESVLRIIKNLRDRYGVAHPFYWGAFILQGDAM